MRKAFLALSLVAISFVGAQAQTSIGIHANGILASFKAEGPDENGQTQKIEAKNRFSWKGGLFASVPLGETFAFMPQLNVVSKGGKINETETTQVFGSTITTKFDGEVKHTYVELPLYLAYNNISETGGFFGGVGPVVSYGIGGKEKYTVSQTFGGSTQSATESSKVKFDGKKNAQDEDAHYKGIEFGAGVIAGYRLASGLFINAQYNLGLSNVSPEDNSKMKNKYVGFGIGYFFGGN
jgi:hypothetical protein